MNGILSWVAASIALMLTVMVLCFYILHEKSIYTNRNMELMVENDSLRSANIYLSTELWKARTQLENYDKQLPLAKNKKLNEK